MAREVVDPSRGTGPDMPAIWRNMPADSFFILMPPAIGNEAVTYDRINVYVPGEGYLNDHIAPIDDRSSPDHWNAQFLHHDEFSKTWKPRQGPLDFVSAVLKEHDPDKPFRILCLGAGLGDFTVDLAKRGSNIEVIHVDFSEQANLVAQMRAEEHGVSDRIKIVTATNADAMNRMIKARETVDFVFVYGGLPDNTPKLRKIRDTFRKVDRVLKDGGYLWFVGLVQPYLLGGDDNRIINIAGEYPSHPDTVQRIFRSIPGWHLIKRDLSERLPLDNHPIVPGGPSVEHLHMIDRMLVKVSRHGLTTSTPEFSFK